MIIKVEVEVAPGRVSASHHHIATMLTFGLTSERETQYETFGILNLDIIFSNKNFNINANYFKHPKSVQEDGKALMDIVIRSMKEVDHGKMHRFCATKAMRT